MPLKELYDSYKIEDFVCDDSFINWVNHGENDNFWVSWLQENEQKKKLIQDAKILVQSLEQNQETKHHDLKNQLWKKIDKKISTPKNNSKLRWLIPAAVAASFALLYWVISPTDSTININTIALQTHNLDLSDDSKIISNENSLLSYSTDYGKNKRKIYLEGEAYFQVTPGNTFEVETPNGIVTVLGTSFNIYAREDILQVECYTGKVRVRNNQGQEVLLSAGEKVLGNAKASLLKEKVAQNALTPTWINANKDYKNESLENIAKDIESYYHVIVQMDNTVASQKVSAVFKFGNLEETMKTITWPLKLSYKIMHDTLTIYDSQ